MEPMKNSSAPVTAFEPEFIAGLRTMFEEHILFNQVLGLKIVSVAPDRVVGRIGMKPELVGHYTYNRIHGGVVSAGLDAMAGLAVMAAIGARHMNEEPAQRLQRFSRLGTIDLRVDYLRPAISTHFELRAEVLRLGSRVAKHPNGDVRRRRYADVHRRRRLHRVLN